jgi:hypothetical protein
MKLRDCSRKNNLIDNNTSLLPYLIVSSFIIALRTANIKYTDIPIIITSRILLAMSSLPM